MLRQIAVIALAAIAVSGCATFDDTDVVAHVDDVEMSQAELERRARASSLVDGDRLSGNDARTTIQSWIALQLADRADIVDAYLQGPGESGVACLYVLPAPDAATADTWVERLDAGEEWDVLVEEVFPGAGATGREQCFPTEQLPEVAEQLAALSVDAPHRSVVFDDGSVFVVRMQTLDELIGTELLDVAVFVEPAAEAVVLAELDQLQIEVAPRYGTFVENDPRLPVLPTG